MEALRDVLMVREELIGREITDVIESAGGMQRARLIDVRADASERA